MSGNELDWQKNVKPIKCGKINLDTNHKINLKPIKNDYPLILKDDFFNTGVSSCLDYNTKSKVDRGKYFISDRLDLHGYNVDDAYYKLMDFVVRNYQTGGRCLLVITGYGSATNKTETIKNSLYKWLNDAKIRHMILYHQQATKEHGGKGASYVLLRRHKNGDKL
jgi:DNA-nicking Smr family endonuclease